MRNLRALLRLTALCAITTGYYLRWLGGWLFVFASPERAHAWRNQNFRRWARSSARAIGLEIQVSNHPPEPGSLLIANHLSYIDVIVISSQLDCAFVAKSEVARWPIVGLLCRSMDTIFVDRKLRTDLPRAMQLIQRTLDRGLGVVLFPEGTSSNGHALLPFKTSLLEAAARNEVPVHYARIAYVVPEGETPVEESVCWWGEMTFPDHLFRLLKMPSFHAKLAFGTEAIVESDRRLLGAKLWSAVSSQLTPAAKEA